MLSSSGIRQGPPSSSQTSLPNPNSRQQTPYRRRNHDRSTKSIRNEIINKTLSKAEKPTPLIPTPIQVPTALIRKANTHIPQFLTTTTNMADGWLIAGWVAVACAAALYIGGICYLVCTKKKAAQRNAQAGDIELPRYPGTYILPFANSPEPRPGRSLLSRRGAVRYREHPEHLREAVERDRARTNQQPIRTPVAGGNPNHIWDEDLSMFVEIHLGDAESSTATLTPPPRALINGGRASEGRRFV